MLTTGNVTYGVTTYVVFGQPNFSSVVDLNTLSGDQGIKFWTRQNPIIRGSLVHINRPSISIGNNSVSGLGEILIGFSGTDTTLLVYSTPNFAPSVNLDPFNTLDFPPGLIIKGSQGYSSSVDFIGDFDGDGISDIAMADNNIVYLLHGPLRPNVISSVQPTSASTFQPAQSSSIATTVLPVFNRSSSSASSTAFGSISTTSVSRGSSSSSTSRGASGSSGSVPNAAFGFTSDFASNSAPGTTIPVNDISAQIAGGTVGSIAFLCCLGIVLGTIYRQRARHHTKPSDSIESNTSLPISTHAQDDNGITPVSVTAIDGPALQSKTSKKSGKSTGRPRRNKSKSISNAENDSATLPHQTSSTKSVTLTAGFTLILSEQLTLNELLGSGGSAKVYRGTWLDTEVAIKELQIDKVGDDIEKKFEDEAKIMSNLRHPKIVQFYGLSFNPYRIVMEYMSGGSLSHFLHSSKPIEWHQKVSISKDIGEGLNFLHCQNPPILHLDLKSMNVLLDRELRAKITDFGLSQMKQIIYTMTTVTHTQHQSAGTLGWMAPELFSIDFDPKKDYTTASDIYSYGVIMWEIATRSMPFAANSSLIPHWVQQGVRPDKQQPIPKETPSFYVNLINDCWKQRREERPTAATVIRKLREMESSDTSLQKSLRRSRSRPSDRNNQQATYVPSSVATASQKPLRHSSAKRQPDYLSGSKSLRASDQDETRRYLSR